ncbi:MAG: peptide chain release factor N(5)-glutamine methyltransferase [Microscillaceae bacterium]|nr:peptide chain release factor N(5)-glutamine methyltransferase [Microscillaceae bacterium]
MEISAKTLFNQARQYLQTRGNLANEEIMPIVFWLLEFYFDFTRAQILAEKTIDTSHPNYSHFNLALQRLAKNEPIQYILGETEFLGRRFKVNPAVLIPRPETEELITWIIADYQEHSKVKFLDFGTGSGCIPISLALELADSQVFAIDISPEALQIAQANAQLHQTSIRFIQADILQLTDGFSSQHLIPPLDFIVSNPPYVRDCERSEMHANVLDFEPPLALFVKDDAPLIFYEKICQYAHHQLIAGGNLYFEINEALSQAMNQLLDNQGFMNIELKYDLRGKPRMMKGTKG